MDEPSSFEGTLRLTDFKPEKIAPNLYAFLKGQESNIGPVTFEKREHEDLPPMSGKTIRPTPYAPGVIAKAVLAAGKEIGRLILLTNSPGNRISYRGELPNVPTWKGDRRRHDRNERVEAGVTWTTVQLDYQFFGPYSVQIKGQDPNRGDGWTGIQFP